jgi:hypothetical protein
MNNALSVLFLEEYFVCTILPNESAWEALHVNGADRLPLFFYVSGGDVRNDAFAKERFEANDAAAFGTFYDTILDPKRTFRRFDLELDPIELLHDVIQQVKSAYFDRMRAFDDEQEATAQVPLNLCFIPGIHRDAKDRIRTFFTAQGFTLQSDADYLDAFTKSLQRKAVIPSRVNLAIVESSFGDLWFHYVECNDGIVKRESELIVGKGVDYRVGNLARLLVEKAGRRTSSRILNDAVLLEQEIKRFHRRASTEIEKFEYDQLDLKIELSDFSSARVIVDRRELDRMSSESFQFIKFRFESFVSKYSNLARTEKILLNGGNLLASNEFIQFFERTFGASKVIRPFDNFIELLSRGVFSMTPESLVTTEKQVEIKITVTTKAVAPGVPPVPPRRVEAPPLPPARVPGPGRPGATEPDRSRAVPAPPAGGPAAVATPGRNAERPGAPPVPPNRVVPPARPAVPLAGPPVPPARVTSAPPIPPSRPSAKPTGPARGGAEPGDGKPTTPASPPVPPARANPPSPSRAAPVPPAGKGKEK